jgi:hypothetical protein
MYNRGLIKLPGMVDEEDQNDVRRMPTGDRGHVAVMDYSDEDDDIRRGENDDMDDLGEDESDEEENDDSIESEEEEEEEVEVHDKSVHKFIRTFRNGDYDQEFDDALSSERSAVVPNTRPTQASYNNLTIGEKGIELD